MNEKKYLIIVSNNSPLTFVNESNNDNNIKDSYILESVFTQFDHINENGRIYTYAEFEPHLKKLQKMVESKKLVGSTDHPLDTEIKLKDASHIIEKLEYDPVRNCIVGKIRLLSNTEGENVKAMLRDGVQLSISSRAIGSVKPDKKVSLDRVITYDIVADGGFGDFAKMKRVNESLGIMNETIDETINIYDISEDVNKDYANSQDALTINTLMQNVNNIISEFSSNTADKMEHLNNMVESYSMRLQHMEEEVKNIRKDNKLSKYENINNTNIDMTQKNNLAESLKGYIVEEMIPTINKLEKIPNYLDDEVRPQVLELKAELKNTQSHLDGEVYNVITHLEEIPNYLDNELHPNIMELKEETRITREYLEGEVFEAVNKIEDMQEQMSKYLDEEVHKNMSVLESYIDTQIVPAISKLERLQESMAKYLDEEVQPTFEKFIDYNEEFVEDLNTRLNNISEGVKSDNILNPPDVKCTQLNSQTNIQNLSNKVDSILESAKRTKEDITIQNNAKLYLNLLTESKKNEYLMLDKNKQAAINKKMLDYKPITGEAADTLFESVVRPQNVKQAEYNELLSSMPSYLKEAWMSLPNDKKKHILESAKFYNLTSSLQKEQFWMNQKSLQNNKAGFTLNEDVQPPKKELDDYKKMVLRNL